MHAAVQQLVDAPYAHVRVERAIACDRHHLRRDLLRRHVRRQ
jgi:hypothetical protein